MAKATYTKLHDESWGIRVQGTAHKGDLVEVIKANGETQDEVVDAVLWTGKDTRIGNTITLCTIQRKASDGNGSGAKSGVRHLCDECGQHSGTVPCRDSSGLLGMCCGGCAHMSAHERSFA